jgi:16S rRNA (guanine527-N7)-methyltransferase
VRRLVRAGCTLPAGVVDGLVGYLDLLGRWNRRINLTSLGLEPITDEAIDRLLVEPALASRHVLSNERLAIDIGSGGGSPAIPLRLCVPDLRMVLVEVKVRKAAFLREAVRQLALANVEVENRRFEELLARTDLHEGADLVTLRAVRADRRLWTTILAFLRPGGRVFWFGGMAAAIEAFPVFEVVVTHAAGSDGLTILQRR